MWFVLSLEYNEPLFIKDQHLPKLSNLSPNPFVSSNFSRPCPLNYFLPATNEDQSQNLIKEGLATSPEPWSNTLKSDYLRAIMSSLKQDSPIKTQFLHSKIGSMTQGLVNSQEGFQRPTHRQEQEYHLLSSPKFYESPSGANEVRNFYQHKYRTVQA